MTSEQPGVDPDERMFRLHLGGGGFVAAERAGRWRLVDLTWPHAIIAVRAEPRPDAPAEVALRFELVNYPQDAPTAMPWDLERNAQLDPGLYPKGEVAGVIFRTDWEGGVALYAAFDRRALGSHPEWTQKHPRAAWTPDRTIVFYVRQVSDALNGPGYAGV